MRFQLQQRINAPVDRVAAAFTEAGFYESLDSLSNLARPELLSREEDGAFVRLRIRYRFIGHLSSAVRAAIDPKKLSWIEDSSHDLAARRVTFTMIADHYADRFESGGTYRLEPSGTGATTRHCVGDLTVRMRLVGGRVESAIVSGLREHLDAEAGLIESWIARHPQTG